MIGSGDPIARVAFRVSAVFASLPDTAPYHMNGFLLFWMGHSLRSNVAFTLAA